MYPLQGHFQTFITNGLEMTKRDDAQKKFNKHASRVCTGLGGPFVHQSLGPMGLADRFT